MLLVALENEAAQTTPTVCAVETQYQRGTFVSSSGEIREQQKWILVFRPKAASGNRESVASRRSLLNQMNLGSGER